MLSYSVINKYWLLYKKWEYFDDKTQGEVPERAITGVNGKLKIFNSYKMEGIV